MPPKAPKKSVTEPSKKTEQKKKEKVIEDKTFGLKNKKGSKQQKFVKMVAHQVQQGGPKKPGRTEVPLDPYAKKKEEKKKAADELNMLFRPVEQKVGKGVDPKSVVCAFFKQGQCGKGDKCKFSHDLNMGRRGEKRSMYADTAKDEDRMDNWDETKLEEVVNKKHGASNKSKPQTAIICKYFLEAVENSKYGWFWECPNGETCHYKHALPPGFQLKKDQKREDKMDEISLEELIEKERAALSSKNLTRVTLESFLKWKDRKKKEKIQRMNAESEKKKSDYKAGKIFGISGREMFEFNPDLMDGDDEEADDIVYRRESDDEEMEDEGPVIEINLNTLASMAMENDGTGTVRKDPSHGEGDIQNEATTNETKDNTDTEDAKLDQAAALPVNDTIAKETDDVIAAAMSAAVNGEVMAEDTPFDENLFDGEDLDMVEEELDTLELDD